MKRLPPSLLAFLVALLVYSVAAGGMLTEQSLAPHYILLADALTHGELHIFNTGNLFDLLVFDGLLYVSSPPMPALLLFPFVALFDAGFSDVLFSVVLGAAMVALVQYLFRRPWLTLFFALGTAHFHFSALGSMWFLAQQAAICFGLLAVWAARNGRWLPAGAAWGAAILSRLTFLFGLPFLIIWLWYGSERDSRWRNLLLLVAPVAIAGLLFSAYNQARFGDPLDFGYAHLAASPNIQEVLSEYGTFHPRFLPCNLWVGLLQPPEINGYVPQLTDRACGYLLSGVNLSDSSAPVVPNPLGMSLLLVSPAFLLLAWARKRSPLIIAAWIGLAGTMLPALLLHNTGSLQFGYRYWMDAAPMWLLLLAAVLPSSDKSESASGWQWPTVAVKPPAWMVKGLILASVAIHVWGFFWLYERFVGMSWLLALTNR
jgi:hypothetical protein